MKHPFLDPKITFEPKKRQIVSETGSGRLVPLHWITFPVVIMAASGMAKAAPQFDGEESCATDDGPEPPSRPHASPGESAAAGRPSTTGATASTPPSPIPARPRSHEKARVKTTCQILALKKMRLAEDEEDVPPPGLLPPLR